MNSSPQRSSAPPRKTAAHSRATPSPSTCIHREQALSFLVGLGLEVRYGSTDGGFVRGIRIDAGVIVYDEHASASNLLHEAGHIAICPGRFRKSLTGNLDASFDQILSAANLAHEEPDSPLSRALLQMSDPEATAWAFAAGVAAGIPHERIIEARDYNGEGPAIRRCLAAGQYLGINGLQHAGMTRLRGSVRYPSMLRWLQID